MFTYRFRMNFEEQEGFSRDIELRSDQTFMDFHKVISENLALDKSLECAFFLVDHRYRKKKQIFQHIPENNDSKAEENDSDASSKKLYMEQCVLSDYIDDPHQKFIYIYDLAKDWTFFIEMLRILPASQSKQYPAIVNSVGGIPFEISRKPIPLPGDEEVDADEDEDAEPDDDQNNEILYSDDELDELDDSGFYDNSIEIGGDSDEGKS